MKDTALIRDFIDKTAYLYPPYIFSRIKQKESLDIVARVVQEGRKEIGEAVLLFLCAVKYLFQDRAGSRNVFKKLEEDDSFDVFVGENAAALIDVAKTRNVQGNLPQRALPIFDIMEKIGSSTFHVIELGASFGLVGQCLLNPHECYAVRESIFPKGQKMPKQFKKVASYLGVELNPPDKDWLLACVWEEDQEARTRNFLDHIRVDNRFTLLKGNAFGFSALKEVKWAAALPGTVILLTSFMLYQYPQKERDILKKEILNFASSKDIHWINQAVQLAPDTAAKNENEYYISLNEKKIIALDDDTCTDWRWLK